MRRDRVQTIRLGQSVIHTDGCGLEVSARSRNTDDGLRSLVHSFQSPLQCHGNRVCRREALVRLRPTATLHHNFIALANLCPDLTLCATTPLYMHVSSAYHKYINPSFTAEHPHQKRTQTSPLLCSYTTLLSFLYIHLAAMLENVLGPACICAPEPGAPRCLPALALWAAAAVCLFHLWLLSQAWRSIARLQRLLSVASARPGPAAAIVDATLYRGTGIHGIAILSYLTILAHSQTSTRCMSTHP